MSLRKPTPYPTAYWQIDRWFGHPIYGWGNISDGPCEAIEEAIDILVESFRDSTVDADLTSVKVVHHNGAAMACDVTESVLQACGAYLDSLRDVGTYLDPRQYHIAYPEQFLLWAGLQQKRIV